MLGICDIILNVQPCDIKLDGWCTDSESCDVIGLIGICVIGLSRMYICPELFLTLLMFD